MKQKVTFRGRGAGSTVLQAGATWALGKASDCLKLKDFGALRFEKLQFQNCKYGVRAISCDDIDVVHCKFIHCGASDVAANFDGSLTISQQLSQYAAEFTDGGALRIESAGKVRVLSCQVYECNRGLRVQDCLAGGLIQGNLVQFTGQAGIYLAASGYTGATGCRDIMVTSNQVINAGNCSLLCIGGFKNSFTQNICRDGWNSGAFLWHCCDTDVSGNSFENCNFSTFNAQGILGDAHGSGVVADGSTDIQQTALYQAKITGNVITFPGLGRAAAIYAIRIMNDAFAYGDKVYCQDNYSQGAAVHVQNDGSATIVDMDTRLTAVFSVAEKTAILADVATLQTAHPVTPVVIENLSDDDDIAIAASSRVVFIKHTEVYGLIATLPASGVANGHTIYIKNMQVGDEPVQGWGSSNGHAVKVRPAQGQSPSHTLDFRFEELILEPSSSTGATMSSENEACRLVYLSASKTWIATTDAY